MDDDRRFGFKRTFCFQHGGFCPSVENGFCACIAADVCFGSGNNRGGRAAKRTVGLRLCGRIVDGAGTCFVSDIFGKDECGRAGLGFSEKSAAALSVSCCCGRRLHDLAERILSCRRLVCLCGLSAGFVFRPAAPAQAAL